MGDPTGILTVILWTQSDLADDPKAKKLNGKYFKFKKFQKNLVSGNAKAKYDDNFTVKVDAQIPSNFNGKTIYYRFSIRANSL